jgi:hypothetical protein
MQVKILPRYTMERQEVVGGIYWKISALLFSNNALLLQDMIHVVDTKPVKRYGDYFLRQIVKVCSFSYLLVFQFSQQCLTSPVMIFFLFLYDTV